MKKRLVYALAIAFGVTGLGTISSLNAAVTRVANVTIPHEFHVSKRVMPGGEYRLEQEAGSSIVTLVNLKTGKQVHLLRSTAPRPDGKESITLVPDKGGYTLKVS